ncbi:MAG: hypothetical protein IV090_24630 [Candidatus Sericytochromatia bacterium]|nr:hypothetical protein [Candidatus Sericytochromatia bacterium]
MSIPEAEIKAALQDWLSPLATTIWQFQNAPEPAGPFFSVNPFAGIKRLGAIDETVWNSETEIFALHQHREALCSIQACGPEALALLSSADDKLQIPNIYKTAFSDRNLAAITGPIRDLSGMKGARFEQRAQMDVTIRYISGAAEYAGTENEGDPYTEELKKAQRVKYSAELIDEDLIIVEGDEE